MKATTQNIGSAHTPMTIADHSPRLSAIIIEADRTYARTLSEMLGKKNCDCLPMATWPDRPVDLFEKSPP